MRGIAALLVCSDHCRHIFFVEYHSLANRLLFLPYLVTSAGHQAVIIFFVLSGFLVGGSVLRAQNQDRWSWAQYLTHRFVRLWLVLIPALLLCAGLDALGLYLQHHNVSLLSGMPGAMADAPILQRLNQHPSSSFPIFIGNIFFVQTILVPVFGTDAPLWSLCNEFWYYILFPCAVLALKKSERGTERVLYGAAFVLLCGFIGVRVLLFPAWVFGALLIYLPRPKCGFASRVAATVIYSIILLGCIEVARKSPLGSDYLLAVATTVYLWILLSATERSSGKTGEVLARGLARFSYTLYLVHAPVLIFLGSLLVHDIRWRPNAVTISLALAFWCATLLYAWVVAALTEFRVDAVKKWAEVHIAKLPKTTISSPRPETDLAST